MQFKKIYLEYVDLKKNKYKFYELELNENKVIFSYGRIGSDGALDYKKFSDQSEARKYFQKLKKQKIKKGYHRATKGLRPSLKNQVPGQMYFDFYS